jgi:SAM-dependent methyltransferase
VEFDLDKGKLPIADGSFDFVVFSEVLEHLHTPQREVKEAWRVLKRGGFIVVTVPLDTFLSPWQVFFEIGCFIRGDILGDGYYRKRCGHIQHFSVKTMSALLERSGFKVVEKDITLLNIGIIAMK